MFSLSKFRLTGILVHLEVILSSGSRLILHKKQENVSHLYSSLLLSPIMYKCAFTIDIEMYKFALAYLLQ